MVATWLVLPAVEPAMVKMFVAGRPPVAAAAVSAAASSSFCCQSAVAQLVAVVVAVQLVVVPGEGRQGVEDGTAVAA